MGLLRRANLLLENRRKIAAGLHYLWDGLAYGKRNEHARYIAAEKLSSLVCPENKFSQFGRDWLHDREFFDWYERFHAAGNYHSADRRYFLRSLLRLIEGLPGDTAECGVYKGASSYLICDRIRRSGKTHHLFDSFQGLSKPTEADGDYWTAADLAVDERFALETLSEFPFVTVHKGWIPQTLAAVADRRFCFVHIDVDIYEPTLASAEFFYPRLVPGGVMLCDDYGFSLCPGARKAFDECLHDKPEEVVEVPTGQAFVVKK